MAALPDHLDRPRAAASSGGEPRRPAAMPRQLGAVDGKAAWLVTIRPTKPDTVVPPGPGPIPPAPEPIPPLDPDPGRPGSPEPSPPVEAEPGELEPPGGPTETRARPARLMASTRPTASSTARVPV
jgi:hypothetical protein